MSTELPSGVSKCPTCIERKDQLRLTPVGWRTYHESDHDMLPDLNNISVWKRPAAEGVNSEWKEYP